MLAVAKRFLKRPTRLNAWRCLRLVWIVTRCLDWTGLNLGKRYERVAIRNWANEHTLACPDAAMARCDTSRIIKHCRKFCIWAFSVWVSPLERCRGAVLRGCSYTHSSSSTTSQPQTADAVTARGYMVCSLPVFKYPYFVSCDGLEQVLER